MSDDVHEKDVTWLVDNWLNGNRKDVIANLSVRHPAIATTFIVQGSQDGDLDRGDCNSICNLLRDDLIKVRDTKGLDFTGRPV